jgi:16S rRNA processing protein RimM
VPRARVAQRPQPHDEHAVAAVDEGAAPSDLVELGVVRGSYGVKGWVRVAPHAAEAAVLRAARRWWLKKGDAVRALEVTGVRRHGGGIVAKWAGCDTPEAAEAWRTGIVAVARTDFPVPPAGEFYWVDLVGAQVMNRAGVLLGKVGGLRNNGAQDLLEVSGSESTPILIPLVEAYVDSIDPQAGLIRVDWEADW